MFLRLILAVLLMVPAAVVDAQCYTNSQGFKVCPISTSNSAARNAVRYASSPVRSVFSEPLRTQASTRTTYVSSTAGNVFEVSAQPARAVAARLFKGRDKGSGLLSRLRGNRSEARYSRSSYSNRRSSNSNTSCPYCGGTRYGGYSNSSSSSGSSYGGYSASPSSSGSYGGYPSTYQTEPQVKKEPKPPFYQLPSAKAVEAATKEPIKEKAPTAKAPLSAKVPTRLVATVPKQLTARVPKVLVATVPNNAPSPSSFLLTAN